MPSLFDNAVIWQTDPAKAFDAFVTSDAFLALSLRKPKKPDDSGAKKVQALRASSAEIYRLMFGKFLRWLNSRQLSLFDVTSDDLIQFLEHKTMRDGQEVVELASRIRYKYLRLIERTFLHLHIEPNPARHASLAMHQGEAQSKAGHDNAMVTLTQSQQAAYLGALPTSRTDNWKTVRDRAMQALIMGAGLKVSEVTGIRIENIGEKDATGSIPISISPGSVGGVIRWHRTQLRPFAVPEVLAWLQERRSKNIHGPLLFPATLQGRRLDPATVYRKVKATFARANITVSRKGGRTLRNSFAVQELNAGADIELVGEFLGHRRRRSTEDYAVAAEKANRKALEVLPQKHLTTRQQTAIGSCVGTVDDLFGNVSALCLPFKQ